MYTFPPNSAASYSLSVQRLYTLYFPCIRVAVKMDDQIGDKHTDLKNKKQFKRFLKPDQLENTHTHPTSASLESPSTGLQDASHITCLVAYYLYRPS